jgi:hypothetical protein
MRAGSNHTFRRSSLMTACLNLQSHRSMEPRLGLT